jgi:hypothetical protein
LYEVVTQKQMEMGLTNHPVDHRLWDLQPISGRRNGEICFTDNVEGKT